MPNKPRPSADPEDLNRFVTFSGTITREELVVPIRFRVRFGVDGELRFRVYPLPMTKDALALRSDFRDGKANKLARYSISALSAAGTLFESESIVLTGTGTSSTPTSAHVTLKLGYSQATFTRTQDNGDAPPTVLWYLRGFESFPAVEGTSALGKVIFAGAYPDKGKDRVTGRASIRAPCQVEDTAAWLTEAERLFLHLRDIMSFAMSRQVGYPIRDTWLDGQWRRVAYSQTKARRSNQHVHHPMRMQEVFDAALAAHFDPPVVAKNLGHAIEWLTMQATYTEMRLTNAMTALENLTNSNLPDSDQLFLPPDEFEAFAERVRAFARGDIKSMAEGSEPVRQAALKEMRAALKGKLLDLNRRPLFDKVMTLAKQWGVPLDGIDEKAIRAAINARNSIVHRGYYYEPERGTREQADLWEHVLAVRELAIRFVLTIIGFKGHYLSFRGGQHDVAFPPPPPEGQESAPADEPAPTSTEA